ncbi:MAG: response regulator [Rickettsiales bacterium]|nr:response regulator [Rickettsiales bacterium]
MRVVITNAKAEFSRVIRAVEQDPISWEGWICAHIMFREDLYYTKHMAPTAYAVAEMSRRFKHIEGVTYVIDGVHMYFICRGVTQNYLRKAAHELSINLNIYHAVDSAVVMFDMKRDWEDLSEICNERGYWKSPNAFYNSQDVYNNTLRPIDNVDYIMQKSVDQRKLRKQTKIMLVEDDPIAQRLFSRVLNNQYEITVASNAKSALTEYILQAPDVVFLDIGLPDHTGYELMHTILAHDPAAYIVMFSGQNDLQNLANSIHLGARGFVGKPFHEERLTHYIKNSHIYHKATI